MVLRLQHIRHVVTPSKSRLVIFRQDREETDTTSTAGSFQSKQHVTPTNLSSYYELHPQKVRGAWGAPQFCTAAHLQRG